MPKAVMSTPLWHAWTPLLGLVNGVDEDVEGDLCSSYSLVGVNLSETASVAKTRFDQTTDGDGRSHHECHPFWACGCRGNDDSLAEDSRSLIGHLGGSFGRDRKMSAYLPGLQVGSRIVCEATLPRRRVWAWFEGRPA